MTTETLAPFDPLADAIAAVDGWPEADDPTRSRAPSRSRSSRSRRRRRRTS